MDYKQIATDLLHAIDGEDWSSLEALFAADAVYRVPGQPVFRGRDEILHYYRKTRDVREGHHAIDTVVQDSGTCVICGLFSGVTQAGQAIRLSFADVCDFRGAVIRDRTVYFFR